MTVSTRIVQVDSQMPQEQAIKLAAELLRQGRLVAFPTESVYGLGANALDAAAVGRIFAAKGRPANNPIIVHVLGEHEARELVDCWPWEARRLTSEFWPGPLSLILPRSARVPDAVTAGGPTVALRAPNHPVAMALLAAASLPIAAPSANLATHVSPTRAEHVWSDLAGQIDMILDGGPTPGGLESTVIDLTGEPRILRPGLITPAQIELVLGKAPLLPTSMTQAGVSHPEHGSGLSQPAVHSLETTPLRSPGMLARHYAPSVPLECTEPGSGRRVQELVEQGLRVAWLTLGPPNDNIPGADVIVMPLDAASYASRIYDVLRSLESTGVDRIVVETPPDDEAWLAIRDRLHRASTS